MKILITVDLKVNVNILVSYRKLTLSRKVSTSHRFRKPQGNTALDFVIVLYILVKRQDLNFFF